MPAAVIDELLSYRAQFPVLDSCVYMVSHSLGAMPMKAEKRRGAEVVIVPSHDSMTISTDEMLAAIDERTLLLPISHVLFKTSYIQDLKAIVDRAHQVGALVLADLYQSAGTIPVDVTA